MMLGHSFSLWPVLHARSLKEARVVVKVRQDAEDAAKMRDLNLCANKQGPYV